MNNYQLDIISKVILCLLDHYCIMKSFFFFVTLGRLILALVKFCDFEIFRFSVCFNLANSWKISELEKMVSDMVFSTCVKLKRVTTCMKILYLVNP